MAGCRCPSACPPVKPFPPDWLSRAGALLPPQVASPFKPTIKSIESVENFDSMWTDLPPQVRPGLLAGALLFVKVLVANSPPLDHERAGVPVLSAPGWQHSRCRRRAPPSTCHSSVCAQDSPCATPRQASLSDHMFEGFTYCSESFLAAAAKADAGGLGLGPAGGAAGTPPAAPLQLMDSIAE